MVCCNTDLAKSKTCAYTSSIVQILKINYMNKLLLFVFLLSVSTFTFAQNGTAGDLTWTIDNRTLTISGNGVIPEYSYTDLAPWYNYRDSISTAVITEGVTRIGSLAFAMCQKLTSVSIAATVESIGATAFSKCEALDSIGLPEGVKTIEDGAFFYCTGLAAVSFPSTVETIGNSIFYKCTKIAHVFVSAQTPPTCGQSVFPAEVLTAAVLHVPAGTKEAYQAADVWKDFASISDGSTFAQINKQRAGFNRGKH